MMTMFNIGPNVQAYLRELQLRELFIRERELHPSAQGHYGMMDPLTTNPFEDKVVRPKEPASDRRLLLL